MSTCDENNNELNFSNISECQQPVEFDNIKTPYYDSKKLQANNLISNTSCVARHIESLLRKYPSKSK
jgi:hypothetical protein